MPHSYAVLSDAEQAGISGGGPLSDALDAFFDNLRLDDFFFGGGLISLSFTFVPRLLLNVASAGFNFGMNLYNKFSDKLHFSREGSDMMQFRPAEPLVSQQKSCCTALCSSFFIHFPTLTAPCSRRRRM